MMVNSMVELSTRAKTYETPKKDPSSQDTSQPNGPLTLKKLVFEPVLCPPKIVLHRTTHNPNSQVDKHYSIVEYLA